MSLEPIFLPDLLGKTESDPLVQAFIERLHLVDYDLSDTAREDHERRYPGESYDALRTSILEHVGRLGAHFVLNAEKFLVDLELLKFSANEQELRVKALSMRRGCNASLPFGLDWVNDVSSFAVGREMDHGDFEHGGVTHRTKSFLTEDGLTVAIVYQEPLRLLSDLTLSRVDESTLLRLKFHDGLKDQKPHLQPGVVHLMARWHSTSPVHQWRKRLMDGDTMFTEAALLASEEELNTFTDNVKTAIAKRSPTQLVNALKKTIKNFNKLTRRHNHFIETQEREELASYLQQVLLDAGLRFDEKFDVTLEWRDW